MNKFAQALILVVFAAPIAVTSLAVQAATPTQTATTASPKASKMYHKHHYHHRSHRAANGNMVIR